MVSPIRPNVVAPPPAKPAATGTPAAKADATAKPPGTPPPPPPAKAVVARLDTGATPAGAAPAGVTPAAPLPAPPLPPGTPGSTPVASTTYTPVSTFTEKQALYTITTKGNFELVAGNGGDQNKIEMADIDAQAIKDTETMRDPNFLTSRSGTEAGEIARRRTILNDLRANFHLYAINGQIDLPTLQAAYNRATGDGLTGG